MWRFGYTWEGALAAIFLGIVIGGLLFLLDRRKLVSETRAKAGCQENESADV